MARTSTKKQAELSLETVLWNCRIALRGIGSTEKNRDAVISLVFLKFAGLKFDKRRTQLMEEHGNIPAFLEKPSFYNAANVFYLDEESRWSYLVSHASDNDIAVKIDKALANVEEKNPSLHGALSQNLFATLGASKSSLKSLIDEVNKIDPSRFKDEDLVGRVYEYFLRAYAAAGNKDDGEFYTPASVVKLIAELIEPYEGVVYDPCCGTGGMFVQSLKFVESHHGNKKNISIIGQESNADTWRLCKMNLAIRGISHSLGEKNASTFTKDLHPDRKVDFIMANPPFNLKGWRGEDELLTDPRFIGSPAMPPVANANYAWILHMISKLDVNNGTAGFLLANGALSADGEEQKIRQHIFEHDFVEAIIVLPRNMFYTTDVSVTLWILNMNKEGGSRFGRELRDRTDEVLFMDLRKWDQNIDEIPIDKNKSKKKVALSDSSISEVKKILSSWQDVDGGYEDIAELCQSIPLRGPGKSIESMNFSATPSKYIKFQDRDLAIDFDAEMSKIQTDLSEILKLEQKSQSMIKSALGRIGYGLD